jgi:hypothetical protein
MKDQILKIAKVKSEKEFYKKYPTEEAFMKAHGKAFKKAAMGKTMVAQQLTQLTDFANPPQAQVGTFMGGEQDVNSNVSFADIYDATDYQTTGMTNQMRDEKAAAQAQQQMAQSGGGSKNKDMENAAKIAKVAMMAMKKGGKVPKLQTGPGVTPAYDPWAPTQPIQGSNTPTGAPGSPANPGAGMYRIQQGNNPSNAPIQQGYEYSPDGSQQDDSSFLGTLGSYTNAGEQLVNDFNKVKGAIKAREKSNQFVDLSRLSKEAAGTRGEISKRRYVRPEDMRFDPNQMNKPKGEGTDYLQLQDGGGIGGNPTEIQNTYAPNSIYTDLEYTPLRDTNIKQFQDGGDAGGGFEQTLNDITAGGSIAADLTAAAINIGTKKRNKQGFQNLGMSALQQGAQQIQGQNSAFMEDGGWVSNDWMPQVITQFGDYKMKDLLKPPHDADMLRAGGHLKEYTPPSERAMQTFDMGGELQTHWGGYTEPASENPYLPDGGVTYMPRGNYHSQSDGKGNTGIGITYGDNPVEVERGEPMVKLEDGGTGEKNLVVLGALDIPNYALTDLKKDAKGKKFKSYGTELTKDTNKQNKMVNKATEKLKDLEVLTPFDNLEMNSLQAQILGGNMKLKDIAAETQKLGALQQAIHDSAKEFGYEDVAKFNKDVKANKVQFGKSQPDTQSAQKGGSFKIKGSGAYPLDYNPLGEANNPIFTAGRYEKEWKPKVEKAFSDPIAAKEIIKSIETYTGEGAEPAKKELAKFKTFEEKVKRAKYLATDSKVGVYHDIMNNIIDKVTGKKRTPYVEDIPEYTPLDPVTVTSTVKKQPTIEEAEVPKQFDWQDAYNTVLPYIRPSNQLPLDPTQLAGEMYALANNQVEPVFAQSYKPMLSTPFDISLQDQLNANQADYNSTQRLVGYNPAALAQLNAQKYAANSAVLGQQTRLNQAEKARVYEANRNILNDAQLKNIGIYDQQMVRQSQAKSNTKAQTQVALNSISDKYSKHELENRTAGIYENLYKFRYDNKGRAINMNPLVDFQEMIDNASPADLAAMKVDLDKKTAKAKATQARNGSIVKAIKNF